MTDSNRERPEPDAYRYESVARTEEKEFRHDAISLNRPDYKVIERLNGEDASAENVESLFSAETIRETIDQKIEKTEQRLERAKITEEIDHWESQLKAYRKIRKVFSGE